jgi:hypothetical protein
MLLPFYLEFLFLVLLISAAARSQVSDSPHLPSPRRRLGGGWHYLHHQRALPMKAKFAKTRASSLVNRILQFLLQLHIAFRIDQGQTVRVSQGVAHWSPSLKYSCVRASTENCINSK